MKMPKTLYVKIEQDGDVSYPVAASTTIELAELGKKTRIGVYALSHLEDIEGVVKRTSRG